MLFLKFNIYFVQKWIKTTQIKIINQGKETTTLKKRKNKRVAIRILGAVNNMKNRNRMLRSMMKYIRKMTEIKTTNQNLHKLIQAAHRDLLKDEQHKASSELDKMEKLQNLI